MPRFKITAPALSGCEFASVEALRNFVRDALDVQGLLDQLNRDGDVDAFSVDLSSRGYDWREIDRMARTRKRPAELFVAF